ADGSQVFYRETNPGTTDLSEFGKQADDSVSLLSTSQNNNGITLTTLLDNAAERTRPQIMSIGDGKKLLLFMGNGGDDIQQLYYSVYDGKWSYPNCVENDGTFDTTPTIKQYGDKVVIAWADADKKFDSTMSTKEKLQSLGISYALYDIKTNTITKTENLVSDQFLNQSPQVVIVNDDIYCTYLKSDIEQVTKEDELLNFTGLYSTMAYVKYNGATGEKEEEKYIEIKHPSVTDPLVMDYHSESFEVDSQDFVAVTYTVDEDENLETGGDRSLWIVLEDVTNSKVYYPIQITSDGEAGSVPKLSKLGDDLYLSYLKNGYLFNLLNVTNLATSLFVTDETVEETDRVDVSVYKNADKDEEDWYLKSAQELGISEETYEGTIFEQMNEGNFMESETSLKLREDATTATSDYKLVYNGNDIFLFFTDVSSEPKATPGLGRELYAMKYVLQSEQEEQEDIEEATGFTPPVQLTSYDKMIDEFDLTIADSEKFSIVTNFFEQTFNEEGTIDYSPNKLVVLDVVPEENPQISGTPKVIGDVIPGDSLMIQFDVVNDGLKKMDGMKLELIEHNNGAANVIETIVLEGEICAKETREVSLKWMVPEAPVKPEIEVRLYDNSGAVHASYQKAIEIKPEIRLKDTKIEKIDDQYVFSTTVANRGGAASVAMKGEITSVNSEGVTLNSYDKFEIPALSPGEEKSFSFELTPSVDDFSSFGMAEYVVTAKNGDTAEMNDSVTLASSQPIVAEINKGEESITLEKGKTQKLSVETAPWGEIAGEVQYYSSDNSVVTVDEAGKISANKGGNATVYAYYPKTLVTDEIDVIVTETKPITPEKPTNPGSQSSGATTKKFTVKFQSNGGSEVKNQIVAKGNQVTEPQMPVKEGFVFDGWYFDSLLTKKYDFNSQVTADMTLYAKWGTGEGCIGVLPKWNNPFNDVTESDWFFKDVEYVNQNNLMMGMEETLFSPDYELTRAMLVTILYRSEREPAVNKSIPFEDVDMGAYYANAVSWAKQNGIVSGMSETEFAPDLNITREQIAAIMHRYAMFKGYDVSVGENTNILSYEDFDSISEYAISSMQYAVGSGLMKGRTETTLNPQDNAKRSECAAILHRFIESNQ
ncbi:MAG: hypothetical protein E7399_08990, partial [Ruminococcaceae bacterium]|nr:hypothetical protein [Oscillospiraceae bacterium]